MNGRFDRQFLGDGVRPRAALGLKRPIWRLGALVSLPYSIGKVIMVSKPDKSLLLKFAFMHRSGNVSNPSGRSIPSTGLAAATVKANRLYDHQTRLPIRSIAGIKPLSPTTNRKGASNGLMPLASFG